VANLASSSSPSTTPFKTNAFLPKAVRNAHRLVSLAFKHGVSSKAYLVILLIVYNIYALLQIVPVNASGPKGYSHSPSPERHIVRVFNIASAHANKPFSETKDHLLYFGRNPAMFLFIDELIIRMGAQSPFPMQILTVLLFNIGLLLCYAWIRRAFNSELMAMVATFFLITTPYLLANSASIHSDPYHFAFFNLTLYLFTRYLSAEKGKTAWLWWTGLSYFVLCQNYWMFYVSTYLMLLALAYKERKLTIKLMALMSIPPIIAFLSVFVQAAIAGGGFYEGYRAMADICAARTGDWRIPDAKWYPNRRYLSEVTPSLYIDRVTQNISQSMGVPVEVFAIMLVCAIILSGKDAWKRYGWLLFAVPAGLSWNIIMIQHTVIHRFSGQFGFFLWMLAAALFFEELYIVLKPERAKLAMLVFLVPLAFVTLNETYIPRLTKYIEDVTSEEALAKTDKNEKHNKNKKNKKKQPRRNQPSADENRGIGKEDLPETIETD
jgi:hypothetical protein